MSRLLIRGSTIIILAGSVPAGPLAAQARTAEAAMSPAASAHALYDQSFQRLKRVQRFQFHETVAILHRIQNTLPGTTRTDVEFLAPDRVATSLQSSRPSHSVTRVEIIQIGTTKCQRPPSWVCYRSRRPDPAAFLQTLLSPQMQQVSYRTIAIRLESDRVKATAIHMSWSGHGLSYSGLLVLQPRTDLPLDFSSAVRVNGQVEVQQSASFDYSHRFTIVLPHGKGVAPRH
jgi:hypothetical protein